MKENDIGTLTFATYPILSYKKIGSAATQSLPPYLCSEQSDVSEVYCKIHHHNWQPLKIQQKGQLLARLIPWCCEPPDEAKGERQRKEVFLKGTALGSWWGFGINSFTVGLAVKLWNELKIAPQCQVDCSHKIITGLFKSNHGSCRYKFFFKEFLHLKPHLFWDKRLSHYAAERLTFLTFIICT